MKNYGDIKLGIKQSRKVLALERLCSGKMTNTEAAQLVGLSVRQVQRLKKKFDREGHISLIHGNTGKKPAHSITDETKDIIAAKALGEYKGTSCQHISELLEENCKICVSAKTIGRVLSQRGIEQPCTHKGPSKRRLRRRRERRGELVQIDASPFDWLSCGQAMSLHGAIDDATSEVLALWLCETERLSGYFHVMERMLLKYGVPESIYMDGHTIFFSNGKLSLEDELEGKNLSLTQFGKALETLCIKPIHASSPQAKGRIERLWGTLQLRLPVDLRAAGIRTVHEANDYLLGYTAKHDKMFSVEPQDELDTFLPSPPPDILKYILCVRENRKASGDSSVSCQRKKLVAVNGSGVQQLFKKGVTLEVLSLMDGSLAIQKGNEIFAAKEAEIAPKQTQPTEKTKSSDRTPTIPSADHPWRRYRINLVHTEGETTQMTRQ
jgi:transposase